MSEVPQTADEVLESLTGFDEMAITQQFGRPVGSFQDDQSMGARALVFVLKRREGMSDVDAREAALQLPLKEILGYFAEESEESGKDSPPSEPPQLTSLPGVS